MSDEHHVTPEEAKQRVCPLGGGGIKAPCVATECMGWRWGWREQDGYETHEEMQLHWSHLVASEPSALGVILTTRLGAEKAMAYGKRWAELWTATPATIADVLHEHAQDEGADEKPSPIEVVDAEAEALDEDDDTAELDEPDAYREAVLQFREAVNELAQEINEAITQATPRDEIIAWAHEKSPGDGWAIADAGISNGIIYAQYRRNVVRRGYCGMAGRA